MIRIIPAALLAIALGTQSVQAESDQRQRLCTVMSEIAELQMERRQRGGLLTDYLDFVLEDEDLTRESNFYRMVEAMAFQAWSAPRYHSPELQRREVVEFTNWVYLTCMGR